MRPPSLWSLWTSEWTTGGTDVRIGRGTTLNAGMSIAYATLDYILQHIKCRTMFATHYHELGQMLGAPPHGERKSGVVSVDLTDVRPGVTFWCTDVEETEDLFSYSYRLRPGINYDSHAIVSLGGCVIDNAESRRVGRHAELLPPVR